MVKIKVQRFATLVKRLDGPKENALDGSWTPLPLFKNANVARAKTRTDSNAGANLWEEECSDLVQRSYPHVAMFNVIDRGQC